MPDNGAVEIRVYCICGQKMKVSQSMFGLPGKCVACRQKIRIPRPDQLPQGLTEIYLKDHPEFLRKGRRQHAQIQREGKRPEYRSAPRRPADAPVQAIPLDILEPLRLLFSLEQKLLKQQELNSEDGPSDDSRRLDKYREQVKMARAQLDRQMQARLAEVLLELAKTRDQIAQAGVAARVGDLQFGEFRQTVASLRSRRDALERMQNNLRGWQAVSDIHAAGGYLDASFDEIPPEGLRYIFPVEPEDSLSLLDQHIDGLREAFLERERAARRIGETKKLQEEGNLPAPALADCLAGCEADKARAEAEISFLRKRLEELSADSASDKQTIQACLDLIRKKLSSRQLDKTQHIILRRELLGAQRDCARAHDLITRTLIAGAAQDVPPLKGSFLRRMAPAPPPIVEPLRLDNVLAWVSGLLLVVAASLPVIDDVSPFALLHSLDPKAPALHWIMVLPVLAGFVIAASGAIPLRSLRGITLGFFWVVFTIVAIVLINKAQYGLSELAVRFREGEPYYVRSGFILIILGNIGALAAALMAMARYRRLRVPGTIGVTATVIAALLIHTGLFSYLSPQPKMVVSSQVADGTPFLYAATVDITNIGTRTLVFAPPKSTARNAFTYALMKEIDPAKWKEVRVPQSIEHVIGGTATTISRFRNLPVAPGDSVRFHYRLDPGNYRSEVRANVDPDIVSQTFFLEPPPPTPEESSEPEPQSEVVPSVPAETASQQPVSTPNVLPTDVELRGIIVGANGDPHFSISIYPFNAPQKNREVILGDEIHDNWVVTEYNRTRQTVTLENNGKILILNRRERIALE